MVNDYIEETKIVDEEEIEEEQPEIKKRISTRNKLYSSFRNT